MYTIGNLDFGKGYMYVTFTTTPNAFHYPPPVLKKRKGGIVMDLVRRLRLRRPRRPRRPRVTHLALYLPRYKVTFLQFEIWSIHKSSISKKLLEFHLTN